MDFEFKRLDFNDMFSLHKYGEEVFEEASYSNSNSRSLIDVNMNDEELKRLIRSIPTSIEKEMDKNIEEDMPITLSMLDKILNNKIVSFFTPNALSKKVDNKVIEAKDSCNSNNSRELYNNIMANIDNIRYKLEDQYNNTEAIVNSLKESKDDLIELASKFDKVIEIGEKDVLEYQNSDIDDPQKQEKINIANRRLLSLRNARISFNGHIQQKDVIAVNLFYKLIEIQEWIDVKYPLLSRGVEASIEARYVNNDSKILKDLFDSSNNVLLDSAKNLKEATETNIETLEHGVINVDAMNKYLKTVNEALIPIQSFIEGKESNIAKLKSSMDKMEIEINKNYEKIQSICTSQTVPALEQPKTLKLEKNPKYE